jgi:glycosyltransferase involved in cell wall biosynthesis
MMGLDPGKKTILFVSMNIEDERKGFQWFKEAIIKLENSIPNWENNYEILAIGRNTDAKHFNTPITYTGRLSNIEMISRAYAAADVFVAPSAQDNLPNTVIESLACGTPVVAFNIGGMPDMIEHEKNGYLAEFQNVPALTTGIQFCLNNNLSGYCRASALDKFNAQAIVNSYTKIYKGISSYN